MREIKFKGICKNEKVWVYGSLVTVGDKTYIFEGNRNSTEVSPLTVGQFTGLKDKNSVDIYEGDIIKHGKYSCVVEHFDYAVELSHGQGAVGGGFDFGDCWGDDIEVVKFKSEHN